MLQYYNQTYNCGLVSSSYDIRDYTIAMATDTQYPESFELTSIPVKNQYSSPTCAAHAGSEIVEYFNKVQEKKYIEFSTEFIYGFRDEATYLGNGMSLRDVLHTLQKFGDVPLSSLPGNSANWEVARAHVNRNKKELLEKAYPNRISGYFQINSTNELKYALMNYGMVLVNMTIYDKYRLNDGVYEPLSESSAGSHAVIIYGWNEKGWLVQNSWGMFWGNAGKFIIPFDFKFNEIWGVTDYLINEKEFTNKFSGWFGRLVAKFINFFVNLCNRLS